MAALLHFDPVEAASEPPVPRIDIVACIGAVDLLDAPVRVRMQSHCLALAIAHCEGPDSGPARACFADMSAALEQSTERLERRLNTVPPRDATDTLCKARFASDINQARCVLVAEFGHVRELRNAARSAGVRP